MSDTVDPLGLLVSRLAIVHAVLRRAEDYRMARTVPERSRSGQLLWLQADGTRTTTTGGQGRRR